MVDNDLAPRPARIRDTCRSRQPSLKQQIFRQAGGTGLAATWSKGHIKPGAMKRGMGTGMRAAAGLIAPGGRRVIVKARYTTISGRDLGAARAHLKYIQRDGVTRDSEAVPRALQVTDNIGPNRVSWPLDRGRTLPPRVMARQSG